MVETINKMMRVSHRLVQEHGREPTIAEIAEGMEVTPERVRDIQQVSQEPVSPWIEARSPRAARGFLRHPPLARSRPSRLRWSYEREPRILIPCSYPCGGRSAANGSNCLKTSHFVSFLSQNALISASNRLMPKRQEHSRHEQNNPAMMRNETSPGTKTRLPHPHGDPSSPGVASGVGRAPQSGG